MHVVSILPSVEVYVKSALFCTAEVPRLFNTDVEVEIPAFFAEESAITISSIKKPHRQQFGRHPQGLPVYRHP
jgi:hypothetical protein